MYLEVQQEGLITSSCPSHSLPPFPSRERDLQMNSLDGGDIMTAGAKGDGMMCVGTEGGMMRIIRAGVRGGTRMAIREVCGVIEV